MKGLLRFFINKKTIVLFGIIAGVAVIVGGYYYRTQVLTGPIEVLVARNDIPGNTQIDESMFIRMKMNSADLTTLNKLARNTGGSLVYKANEASGINGLVGKYVKVSATIPKGGLFYKDIIVSEEEMPNYIWHGVENNQTIFNLEVNDLDTDFSSIKAGQNISIWARYTDEAGILIKGCYIASIKVYIAKPKTLSFIVDDHYYQMLTSGGFSRVTFYPVPVGNMDENSTCDGSFVETFIGSKIYADAIE